MMFGRLSDADSDGVLHGERQYAHSEGDRVTAVNTVYVSNTDETR